MFDFVHWPSATRRADVTEVLVDSNFVLQRAHCFALTKKALCLAALLSSLGLWAAVWAAAASLASAWLQ